MGGEDRQRKSSFGFFRIFNIFKYKKLRGEGNKDAYDHGMKAQKNWHSDGDGGPWAVGDPVIDRKAGIFIAWNKKRVSQSD